VKVALGTYQGDATDDRNITIPNWGSTTPNLLLIWALPLSFNGVMAYSVMPANNTTQLQGEGLFGNAIQAFQAGGFQIGDGAGTNSGNQRYYYLALGGAPTTDFNVLSYVGDGLDLKAVTGAGFAPDMAIIIPSDTSALTWSSTSHTVNTSNSFEGGVGAELIKSFGVDGIVLGPGPSAVNTNGLTYYVAFLKKTAGVFNILSYAGNGVSDRVISGAGFKPDAVLIESTGVGNVAVRYFHFTSTASVVLNTSGSVTDGIRWLENDGFKVGTNSAVNDGALSYIAPVFGATVPLLTLDGAPVRGAVVMAARAGRHQRQVP